MTSREKSILIAVSTCHALVHAYMLIFPTIYKSLGKSLDLEFSGVGFVGMASYLAFGFGALPAGFLSDRLGSKMLLVLCIGGTTIASVVAFTLTTPVGVVIALILLGLFAILDNNIRSRKTHGKGLVLKTQGLVPAYLIILNPSVEQS